MLNDLYDQYEIMSEHYLELKVDEFNKVYNLVKKLFKLVSKE